MANAVIDGAWLSHPGVEQPWWDVSSVVALDGVVGLVPFAGDAFDVMFRANMRNMRILKRWMDKQPRA